MTAQPTPKTLYFDLDGTIIHMGFGDVKLRLADGAFERAVRQAGFERLLCVANAVAIVHALEEIGQEVDGVEMIFRLALGAIGDLAWFRRVTTLVEDPRHRARFIDLAADWWWIDDSALHYLALEGMTDLFSAHRGGRILAPNPDGDGRDVIEWLERVGRSGPQKA
jgi:hypothetical protein